MGRVHMPKGTPNETRFWSHVNKGISPDECWTWKGGNLKGYGIFHERLEDGTFKTHRAHRYSFELVNGPIPDGMVVLHSCDHPGCTNPRHLSVGTQKDNLRDSALKGRSYHKWLDDESIYRIKRYKAAGFTQTKIAESLGVHQSTISNIVRGRRHAQEVHYTHNATKKVAHPPAKELARPS